MLLGRKDQYKEAAMNVKKSNDIVNAKKYIKTAKVDGNDLE